MTPLSLYLLPFLRHSTSNNGVTLNCGLLFESFCTVSYLRDSTAYRRIFSSFDTIHERDRQTPSHQARHRTTAQTNNAYVLICYSAAIKKYNKMSCKMYSPQVLTRSKVGLPTLMRATPRSRTCDIRCCQLVCDVVAMSVLRFKRL